MASANKKGNDDWQKRKAITDAYTKRGLNYAEGDKIVDDWLKSGVSTESALETIGKAGRQELGTGAKGANKIHAQPHQDEDGNWHVGKYTAFGSTDGQANFAHLTGHTQGTRTYLNDFYKSLADKDVIEKHNLTGTETFTGAGDEVFQSGGWLDLLQSGGISQQDFEKNVFDFYKDPGKKTVEEIEVIENNNNNNNNVTEVDNWWNQWANQNEFGDWLKDLLGGQNQQNQQSGWPWGGYGPPVGAGGVGINYGPGGGYLSGATGGIYNQFNRGSGGAANRAALQSLGITL